MAPPAASPGADLHEVVELAIAREGHLLTAGEIHVLRAILALAPEPLELYARLSLRVGPVFRFSALRYGIDVPVAAAELVAAGLAHATVPHDLCIGAFDADALRAACQRLGLPTGGRRAVLEARLRGTRWVDEPVLLVAHLGLLARADLFYFQRSGIDRGALVVERVGAWRWASHPVTGGPGLASDRRSLLRWERARAEAWLDPGEPLRIALEGPRGVGLCPWRRAVEAVMVTDPPADVVAELARRGATVLPRLALTLEAEGREREALELCRTGNDADPATPLALDRTGRRLARRLGTGWAPREPLRAPRERVLRLRALATKPRPTWVIDGRALLVEEAVLAECARAGREGVHAEGGLWTSLFALVFRDLYWLPVPGMLPTARREGPLDVGTPGFYERRRADVDARLAMLCAEGPARFLAGWEGERLAGLGDGAAALRWAPTVPGRAAAVVLGRLAREGWRTSRGLPDLWIPPGPPASLPSAIPSKLVEGGLLVEVKGPSDALRDEQRVWHDHLLKNEIPVEIWRVAPNSLDSG